MTTRPPLGATERSTPSGTGLASVLNGYLDRHRPSEEVVVAYASREIAASTADVYAVLIDPRSYPSWLAGAKEIREVDADWPAPGSRFHHRVRFGPITVADSTEMIAAQPCQRIELAVRARPFVSAIVTFALVGDDRRCMVSFEEEPRVRLVGNLVRPVMDPVTHMRNHHSLKRLEQVAKVYSTRISRSMATKSCQPFDAADR
jgi:uncharacterized protein YndB with AHSA1/START domain